MVAMANEAWQPSFVRRVENIDIMVAMATALYAPEPPITFVKTPILCSRYEFSTKVVEVVASKSHCLILTSDGEILSFGFTKLIPGGKSSFYAGTPYLIGGKLKGKIFAKVSCGANFSVAIRDNGMVYAWGSNSDVPLGTGDKYCDPNRQYKIKALMNVIIKNIICGKDYVLAVSNLGELYSWGENYHGQLGLGDYNARYTPIKVDGIGKVIDIAATSYGSTSAAMNENNEVYAWGYFGEMCSSYPYKTQFETLFDAFASTADPGIMHRPMKQTLKVHSTDVAKSIQNAFEDPRTSDLTIVVDGREIFVHKAILRIRSDYFEKLLQKLWFKEDKKVLKINQNYEGFYAYLRYLYYGDFKGNPEVALESLKIAHKYHDLAFKKLCEKRVSLGIAVENVAYLYALALKLHAQDLAKDCVRFASKHIEKVFNSPSFSKWDADTHKQFIKDCQKQYTHCILDQKFSRNHSSSS